MSIILLISIVVFVGAFVSIHQQHAATQSMRLAQFQDTLTRIKGYRRLVDTPHELSQYVQANSVAQFKRLETLQNQLRSSHQAFMSLNSDQSIMSTSQTTALNTIHRDVYDTLSVYAEALELTVTLPLSEHEYFITAISLHLQSLSQQLSTIEEQLLEVFVAQRRDFFAFDQELAWVVLPILAVVTLLIMAVLHIMKDAKDFIYVLFCNGSTGRISLAKNGDILAMNRAALAFFGEGRKPAENNIKHYLTLNWTEVEAHLQAFKKRRQQRLFEVLRRKQPARRLPHFYTQPGYKIEGNRTQPVLFEYTFLHSLFGSRIIATVHDQSHVQDLQRNAEIDSFTELKNKTVALERLRGEMERAKRNDSRLAVVFFDIDGFKHINDRYGHPFGDKVILWVANKIKQRMRQTDILGRFGGDEFMIICPECNTQQAHKIAQSIQQKLTGEKVSIQISVGVTELANNDTVDTLVKRVDQAMYKAKQDGKNQICTL